MTMEALPQDLADFLVTKNFDPEYFDKQGQPSEAGEATTIKFDYVADSGKNYGTAVCVISNDELSLYYGDNLGRGMEPEDKDEWYSFLEQLSNQAASHSATWSPTEINKLKHNLAGIAAIKEGLFEGYYGSRKVSYMGEQTQARLVINHNRVLGENDKRFRYVESLFIETADQERFRLPFKSLAAGRAMLEHVRQGGRPYDVRGNHITEIVGEMAVLSRFNRAQHHRVYEGVTQELVESAEQYYRNLQETMKHLGSPRGYQAYFESWAPDQVGEAEALVENLRDLFVEQTLDARIEAALPTLAKIQQQGNNMKEAQIFENWVNQLSEGTWALPETPEQQEKLNKLMSGELIVGPDATNATEQLNDIVGDKELFDILEDLADNDPRANIWDDSDVQRRLAELGVQTPQSTAAEPADVDQDIAEDQVNEAQTYGRDNPYEVKPGENFSKVFEPGRKSGVHYHLMRGSVADPFYFKLNNKLYSVSQNGDGIPREVGVDDNDLGNDVPMPSLIDYGKSSTQDPNLQLAKDYAKLYGHYDPEDMDDINSLLYVMRSNPRVKADIEREVEWARSKNKGVAESQLDEIGDTEAGQAKLNSYVNTAVDDAVRRSNTTGYQKGARTASELQGGPSVGDNNKFEKDPKIDKRQRGIGKAITRMGGGGGGYGGVRPGQSPSLDNPIQNENAELARMLKHAGVPLREGVLNDDTRNTWDHLLDRFRHEVENFKQSGKLDDDLYDALFDYYDQHGAMPYRVRNAKDNTANQWIRKHLSDDLGINENLISPMIMPVSEGSCNMTMEGSYCPEHGLAECGGMYEDSETRQHPETRTKSVAGPGRGVVNPAPANSMGDSIPHVEIRGFGPDFEDLPAGKKLINPMQPRRHNELSPLKSGDSTPLSKVANVDLTMDEDGGAVGMPYSMGEASMGLEPIEQDPDWNTYDSEISGSTTVTNKDGKDSYVKKTTSTDTNPAGKKRYTTTTDVDGVQTFDRRYADEGVDDPINYNAAMTGAYYEGKETQSQEGDALLARIKSLALLR